MLAHRMKIMIPDNHEVVIHLPKSLPAGEAEVIVLADATGLSRQPSQVDTWLNTLAAGAPDAPAIPLEALRRENLYE